MKRIAPALAVMAAIVAVYWKAAGAYFYEDDFQWLMSTFTFQPWHIFDIGAYRHFYRPVIELYFWAATPLFGGSPALFHTANIAVHAVNALLLFLFVREATTSERHGFLAAVFFIGLPGYIEAVAWIGALAEPIGAMFGCLALWGFLRFTNSRREFWRAISLGGFALALLTHESSVVFFPALVLAGWAFAPPPSTNGWRGYARRYTPYIVILIVYLAIDIPINSRSYLIGESHYRPGVHIVGNILDYIVTLYVGQRNLPSYVCTGAVVILLLARGSRRVRFATLWMLLALMPFAPFTWANTSRYLYLPAMGFAMLVAELVEWVDRAAARRLKPAPRNVLVGLLATAIAVRFCLFAAEGVERFAARTDVYRQFIAEFRQQHPVLPRNSEVPIDKAVADRLHHKFLESAVQWEFKDPTIRLVPISKQ
jgi:hypothetical protein